MDHVNIESALRVFWQEVLGCDAAPDDADFFELGGSSMAAVHLAALVQEHLGVALDAVEVVTEPTLAAQAAIVASRLAATR